VKRLREQRKPEASWMPWARRYWKLYLRSSIHEKQQINAMSWGKFDVPFADVPHPNERDMPWLRPEDRV
jgi:hypothetical protein